jgi:hypothetical protein
MIKVNKNFVVFDLLRMLQFITKLYLYKINYHKKWDNKF